jgi:hypothetical protein
MAFFDGIVSNFIDRIADAVSSRVITDSGRTIAQARAYRLGKQPKQLKVKPLQYDDNIILNMTGLIANRSVSQLIGGGVKFKFEDDNSGAEIPQKTYIEAMWDANHQEILLHRACLAASEAGTGYFLLCDPAQNMGGVVGEDGVTYPRIMMLDPAFMTMDTLPEDFEMVTRYTVQYKFTGLDGKEAQRKKIIDLDPETETWSITDYESTQASGGRFLEVGRLDWIYPFSPVVHWQNLPTIDSPYGEPDITDDTIETQNSLNGDVSSLNKSLRLGADPLRWARNYSPPLDKDGNAVSDIGAGRMINVGSDGEINQLPPATDWNGSLAFAHFILKSMFNISRTVDLDSIQVATLTNFGIKVLYQDNTHKIDTKRELFGDALEEINRRAQMMAGMEPVETETIWPEFLPVNLVELVQYFQTLIALGIMSKQTAAEKLELSWDQEQKRREAESAVVASAENNIGAMLLRNFNRGGGVSMPPNPAQVVTNNNGGNQNG